MHKAKSSNAHYDSVSAFYDKAWFYKQDSNFHRWYVERVAERLDVRTGERVVDFGGGDGTFSQTLHHKFPTATMLVVDPSPGMVEKVRPAARATLTLLRSYSSCLEMHASHITP